MLPQLEQVGWHIRAAIKHTWAGERDWYTLVDEMNVAEALLLLRVLETLDSESSKPSTTEER